MKYSITTSILVLAVVLSVTSATVANNIESKLLLGDGKAYGKHPGMTLGLDFSVV